MIDWYAIPITERVKVFLDNNTRRLWCSVGYIACITHAPIWQVEAQLNELVDTGVATYRIDSDSRENLYIGLNDA